MLLPEESGIRKLRSEKEVLPSSLPFPLGEGCGEVRVILASSVVGKLICSLFSSAEIPPKWASRGQNLL